MIGFHVNSPLDGIVHYQYPDENWHVTVTQFGDGRAKYANRHAHAILGHDAGDFMNHPGDIAVFAKLHVALETGRDRFTLDAKQVRELIGDAS